MLFDNTTKLVALWNPESRILEKLSGSGFENLHKLQPILAEMDRHLVEALVESYNTAKECFVFNGNSLILGLKDVWFISGLPVNGNAVSGSEPKLEHLGHDLLGTELSSGLQGRLLRLEWLRDKFEKLEEGASKEKIEQHARAYTMYLIGCFIAPEPKPLVPTMYLSLLDNVEKIKNFAWGAALLAHLMSSIDDFRSGRVNYLRGNLYVLKIFAMERFAKLVPGHLSAPLAPSFPLLVWWSEKLDKTSNKITRAAKRVGFYRGILSQLEHSDINWEPYSRLVGKGLVSNAVFAYQAQVFLSRTIVLCYDKVVYHRPDLAPEQFGFNADHLKKDLPNLLAIRRRNRRGTAYNDWRSWAEYRDYFKVWLNRGSLIVVDSEENRASPNCNDASQGLRRSIEHPGPSNNAGNLGLTRSKISTEAIEKDSPNSSKICDPTVSKPNSVGPERDRFLPTTIPSDEISSDDDDDDDDEDDNLMISDVFKFFSNSKSAELDEVESRSFLAPKQGAKNRSEAAIEPRERAVSEGDKAMAANVEAVKNRAIERLEHDPITGSTRTVVCLDEDDRELQRVARSQIERRVSRLERLIGELKRRKALSQGSTQLGKADSK